MNTPIDRPLSPAELRELSALLGEIFDETSFRSQAQRIVPDVADDIPSYQVAYEDYRLHLLLALEKRGLRAGFIDELMKLDATRGRRARLLRYGSGRRDGDDCPYPGLAAYRVEEHGQFFGREAESDELLELLPEFRWLWVEGASGAGKSSLIAAGLLPRLGREGGRWRVVGVRPGALPIDNLAQALWTALPERERGPLSQLTRELAAGPVGLRSFVRERAADGRAFLLWIDQLEECRTFADPAQARHFDALVAAALDDEASRFHLITTIRVDQVGEFLGGMPELAARINRPWVKRYALRPIGVAELDDVIAAPAALRGRSFQDGLVEAIRADAAALLAGGAEGCLPLLAHALRELWFACAGDETLHFAAYQRLGRIEGAMARSAEAALVGLERLDPSARERARRLLLALATVDRQERWTRQAIAREQALRAIGGERPEVLLAALSGQSVGPDRPPMRFVTTSMRDAQGRIDLIHEALLSGWPTLRGWLAEAAAAKRESAALHEAAVQWRACKEERAGLPGGMLRARYLAAAPSEVDPELDRRFQAALRQDVAAEARARRRRRHEIGGVLALVFGTLAWVTHDAMSDRDAAVEQAQRIEDAHVRTRGLLDAASEHATRLLDTTKQMAGVCPKDVQEVLRRDIRVMLGDVLDVVVEQAPAPGSARRPDAPSRAEGASVAAPTVVVGVEPAAPIDPNIESDSDRQTTVATSPGVSEIAEREIAAGKNCQDLLTLADEAAGGPLEDARLLAVIECINNFRPRTPPGRGLREGAERRLISQLGRAAARGTPSKAIELVGRAEKLDLEPASRKELTALREAIRARETDRPEVKGREPLREEVGQQGAPIPRLPGPGRPR